MDKNILKKFAIESRQDLMEKIKNKINTFYIDEDFKNEQKGDVCILSNEKHSLSLTNDEYKNRELLIKRIKELSLEQVIEEATYTWFNRIIAIRYMEINDILPLTKDNKSLGIRVLSSKDNTPDPEILKFTNLINPDLDIDFKKEKYAELKDNNEKLKYVLLLVCKKLGRVIPQVFDGITDYIDILIPDNLLNDTGFITKIINDVPKNNYSQVEIIGWLYQYYNQTEKDRVMSENRVYKEKEIAYVTQLFTPDWIVKYMIENSLGRLWYENNSEDDIANKWKYFIKENIIQKNKKIDLKDITFIDPCCGSGHILVYAFELFYQMYIKAGYNKNDIAELILKNNIYGLDIDDRAGQLSILSVILKAREYDKNIFNKKIISELNIMSIPSSDAINISILDNLNTENEKENAKYLIDNFKNAKEIGSLLLLENRDYSNLEKEIDNNNTIFGIELNRLYPFIKVSNILTKKYDVVVTNPPYMNERVMPNNLKIYLSKYYKDSKTDLCTTFMEIKFIKDNGYIGIINQHSWMFLSSFEKLRLKIINEKHIETMLHLGTRAFEEIVGEVVQTTTFILKNKIVNNNSLFYKFVDFPNAKIKEEKFLNERDNIKYTFNQNDFLKISGNAIIYWFSKNYIDIYNKAKSLNEIAVPKQGLATGENNRFLREWFEVDIHNTLLNSKNEIESRNSQVKWYPYNKGGEFRKWYGNNDYVVNWENDGYEIKNFKDKSGKLRSRPQNLEYYFKESITWSKISGGSIAFRYKPFGHIFDVAGTSIFSNNDNLMYLLGLNNTKVILNILKATSPTLNFEVGQIASIPVIYDIEKNKMISKKVKENIELSKRDWDMFETSWDFKLHPLIPNGISSKDGLYIQASYENFKDYCESNFNKLKENEEELNKIFIDIYGLNNELSKEVDDKDITIRKANKKREIKSLISYAVGCMFGRYSLDEYGLIFAGGNFDRERYKTYKVDDDNIIPITDEAYFGDDIVERFKNFIKVVYGKETFNKNIDFIAETLGKKGTETSEDTIRRYFLNDFFDDHIKIYKKRPIYWLFDSGKKNGFKALIYMHRFNENLIPKLRLDYLHRVQTTYEKLLSDVNYKLTTELSLSDKKAAQNRQADLNAKLNEIKEYDEKIAHIANQRINIDLDDGVKVNYDKFKDILAKIK